MVRAALVTSLMIVLASACSTRDPAPPEAVGGSVPPTSAPPSATEPEIPARCGSEMPVFASGLDPVDQANIDGTPGPGPDSEPAADGQLVTHWLGQYANYELRWPPSTDPAALDDGPLTVAGLPTSGFEVTGNRGRLIVEVDQAGDPCDRLSVEVYGTRVDPLFDEIVAFSESLRPRSEAAAFLDDVAATRDRAEGGLDHPAGECAEPLVVDAADLDDRNRVADEVAVELAHRFLRDRLVGRRAHDCLTVSALDRYSLDQPVETGHGSPPELCLFECGSGAVLVGPEPPVVDPAGSSGGTLVLALIEVDDPLGSYREQLEVQAVERPDGSWVALIVDVIGQPESFVDARKAEALVDRFLTALGDDDFEIAAGLLINEGTTQEVEDALGDLFESNPAQLLKAYCRQALCDASYRIVGSSTPHLFGAEVTVEFDGPSGPVVDTISVTMFEGQLSIGSVPPSP